MSLVAQETRIPYLRCLGLYRMRLRLWRLKDNAFCKHDEACATTQDVLSASEPTRELDDVRFAEGASQWRGWS